MEEGETMTVKDIVILYLKEHGYDGLYNYGECGCKLDDLIPCDESCSICEPGYKVPCDPETCRLGDDCPWHIGEKP